MTRLLFIVNEHPNEAFAISAARETAKKLGFRLIVADSKTILPRAKGNEIVWYKVRPEETLMGRVVRHRGGQKIGEKEAKFWTGNELNARSKFRNITASNAKAMKLIGNLKPDMVYDWHAEFWRPNPHWDFQVRTVSDLATKVPFRVVEVGAVFPVAPDSVLEKAEKATTPEVRKKWVTANYLAEVTSGKLTRKVGLTPKKYATEISRIIRQEIKTHAQGQRLGELRQLLPKARYRNTPRNLWPDFLRRPEMQRNWRWPEKRRSVRK